MRFFINLLVIAFALNVNILCGCDPREAKKAKPEQAPSVTGPDREGVETGTPRLRILCSFLPLWVFTKNVVGEAPGVDINVLVPGHQGPHDYQLTPADMKMINEADLFIANGFHLEEFLIEAARRARPGVKILEAARAVDPIHVDERGRWVEGKGPDYHGHGQANREESPHEHHGHGGINPHPFASPRDAALMVRRIGEALAEIDAGGSEAYIKNASKYAGRLEALADEFRAVVQASPNKKVVTFHNAFDYLARDAGLEIIGVIETVPGQEPSAGELARLAERIKESGAVAVFAEPQFSPRLAEVLAEEAGVKMDFLDPAATGELEPDQYERAMRKNLQTLTRVLEVEDGR